MSPASARKIFKFKCLLSVRRFFISFAISPYWRFGIFLGVMGSSMNLFFLWWAHLTPKKVMPRKWFHIQAVVIHCLWKGHPALLRNFDGNPSRRVTVDGMVSLISSGQWHGQQAGSELEIEGAGGTTHQTWWQLNNILILFDCFSIKIMKTQRRDLWTRFSIAMFDRGGGRDHDPGRIASVPMLSCSDKSPPGCRIAPAAWLRCLGKGSETHGMWFHCVNRSMWMSSGAFVILTLSPCVGSADISPFEPNLGAQPQVLRSCFTPEHRTVGSIPSQ